jgi:hypothetical protein
VDEVPLGVFEMDSSSSLDGAFIGPLLEASTGIGSGSGVCVVSGIEVGVEEEESAGGEVVLGVMLGIVLAVVNGGIAVHYHQHASLHHHEEFHPLEAKVSAPNSVFLDRHSAHNSENAFSSPVLLHVLTTHALEATNPSASSWHTHLGSRSLHSTI